MSLHELHNWEPTRNNLHRAAKLLNAVRLRYLEPMPNHLHHSLNVTPTGLTTGVLTTDKGTVEVKLDFSTASVNGAVLNGHSLKTLSEAVLTNAALDVPMTNLTDDTPFEVNEALSADYAQSLYSIFTAFARFKARLAGATTPLVLWSHHFDLSFLWFSTTTYDESAPHLNFGFSPGDEGIPRPYFYAYVYPAPDNQTSTALPLPARWHSEGWTGVRIDYDDVRNETDTEVLIESLLLRVFDAIAPLLKK
jgi:hypothetical protein